VDGLDDLDRHGRIYIGFRSAGGRKVASSNLAAPTARKPAGKRASGLFTAAAQARLWLRPVCGHPHKKTE